MMRCVCVSVCVTVCVSVFIPTETTSKETKFSLGVLEGQVSE
jgi:hypothetical protein